MGEDPGFDGAEGEDDPFVSIVKAAVPPLVLRCKIALLGDSGAGKTSLVQVFQNGEKSFPKQYNMTIGIELSVKRVPIPDEPAVVVEMYIVDCGGFSVPQEDLLKTHWESANAVMFVYDVSNPESFNNLGKWYEQFRQARPEASSFPGVVVASKADLSDRPGAVTSEQGQTFCRDHAGLEFFESCAARASVDDPFVYLAQSFYGRYMNRKEELRSMKTH
jgi:small GTP-binding protein